MILASLLIGCSSGGGNGSTQVTEPPAETAPPPRIEEPPPSTPPRPLNKTVAAWGDSLTSGTGSASEGMSYPEQLAQKVGRSVFNGGVSGQTSDQIAARQGGAPALLSFEDNRLPASGPAAVIAQSTFPITPEGPGPIPGSVAGVAGRLERVDDRLVFVREAAGEPVAVAADTPFIPDDQGRRDAIAVFWYGTNNFWEPEQVKRDIAASVAYLTTDRYLVLGVMNAPYEPRGSHSYETKLRLNADLAETYGERFIDIRQIMIDRYDPNDPQDVEDRGNDVPPSSLRHDAEHPNTAGYAIVAEVVAEHIRRNGW